MEQPPLILLVSEEPLYIRNFYINTTIRNLSGMVHDVEKILINIGLEINVIPQVVAGALKL